MKKQYVKKTFVNIPSIKLVSFALLLIITYSTNSYSQVRVDFETRTSQAVYSIKGDFSMIGNTNLTLVNYDETSPNNGDMKYVDIDGDPNTLNSSSSVLTFSTENGALPECSSVVFAGLYWVGRADTGTDDNDDGDNNPNTFQVTKNGITKNYDKQKVHLKGPTAANYTEIVANEIANVPQIYYPTNIDSNIFSAFADVTQYVKDNGVTGEYSVADIALNEGSPDVIGLSGGWGMVVIYENSKMKWRDITVFDGHAYVRGGSPDIFEIDVDGFQAAATGDVNIKLGVMASEGELQWVNDFLEIERLNSGTFERLTSGATNSTTNNFFVSAINTGGNDRTPDLVNNTGIDIAMFDIPNTNKSLITNGQTSTRFRYGSNQDTFAIFNLTFAVDAFVPEPEGVLTNVSIDGNPPGAGNSSLEPNEGADYAIEIKNTGTEATNNTTITIPLPDSVNPSGLSINYNLYSPLTPITNPNIPFYDSGLGSNGSIVWNIGTLPVPTDPDTILADISFVLTVTTDCSILGAPTFDPNVSVNGTISGVGDISNLPFNFDLIQGYETGLCNGNPIPTPSIIPIEYLDYVNEAPTASNPTPINVECIADVPVPDAAVVTDEADNSGIAPIVAHVSDVSDGNSCPETITRTYSVTDDCGNSINVTQTITVNDTTLPTVSGTITESTVEGCIATDATAPVNTVAALEALGLAIADNCTDDANLVVTSADIATGSCPIVVTRTYTIMDTCNNFIIASQVINVNDTTLPTVTGTIAESTVQGCTEADVTAPVNTVTALEALGLAIADNCTVDANLVVTSADTATGTCPIVLTRTYTITDECNNLTTATQVINVNDTTLPTVTGTITVSTVEGCTAADATAPVNTVAALEALGLAIADNCTDDANLVVTSADTATGTCPIVVTRTYTITDTCNNFITASQIINVNDTTLPTASNPATITVPGGPVPAPDVNVVIDEADNCTVNPVVAFVSDVSDNNTCPETITRTYSITDDCLNTINVTQTILITDPILPTASNPADINVECIDDVPTPDVAVVTDATDNQGTPVVAFVSDVSDGNSCPETITRTYSVTDICNNQILITQNIIVNDVTLPTVTGTITVSTVEGCTAADATTPVNTVAALEALGLAIADNCTDDANLVVTSADAATGTCPIVVTRTYTITDACNNFITASQIINVNDTILPTASNPATITVPGGPVPAPDINVVIDEADNCTVNPVVAFVSDVSDNNTCPETITRTYSITDDCLNTINVTQTILITDPILPTASNPADINVECIDDVPTPDVAVVTDATDNQGTPVVAFVSDVSDGNSCPETITRTYSVTDICNNQILVTQNIIINDVTLPTVIGTITVSTVEGCTAADATAPVNTVAALEALGLAIADNCTDDANLVVTSADAATGTCPIVVTRTYTITDACNNFITASQIINVNDTILPTASNPGDINVQCQVDVPTPNVNVVIDEADNCTTSANLVVAFVSDVSDNNTCAETITRTYSITDECGNSMNVTQTIIIDDTTPPVLTLPANQTAECSDDLTPIAFGEATATDNCDTNPVITFVDARQDGACSGTFKIIRTWTATDSCGNEAFADQEISTSDTTAPEFVEQLPQDLEIECDSIPVAETLTATDNCGDATVELTEVRTNGNCPNNYIITRTWIATDDCGLTNTHIQKITVEDTTPPVFEQTTLPLLVLIVECDAIPDAETLTATDTCGLATVTVEDVREDGDCPNSYRITRTWTATDECGLTTTHTQIITVQDTTPPTFDSPLPSDSITVECDAIPTTETLTATDNCGDATVTVEDVITNGDCPNNYIIARTWTATDECGLTTTHTQVITVQDTTAPIPTSTIEETLNVSCTEIPDVPELTFTDNCSTNIIVVFNETNSFDENAFVDYEIVRTWTVRDECNNEETYTQTLQVALDEVITEIVAPDWCYDEGMINMNNLLSDGLNTNGTWELLEGDPAATLNGSVFDPTGLELSVDFLPKSGGIDYKFKYTTTDQGCISITEITMNVHADCVVLPCGENDVVISKAVTPNGDAYNEFFEISGIELCGFQYEIKIFNRWGALVYESDNYQNDWNGIASDKSIGAAGKVPNGTYYYIIKLLNSGLNPITGPVYLGTK